MGTPQCEASDPNSHCSDVLKCTCMDGYENENGTCTNIDECVEGREFSSFCFFSCHFWQQLS